MGASSIGSSGFTFLGRPGDRLAAAGFGISKIKLNGGLTGFMSWGDFPFKRPGGQLLHLTIERRWYKTGAQLFTNLFADAPPTIGGN
jgi:hypothetical protein